MTKIEWVKNADGTQGKSWNVLAGCSKASPGCLNCYAERMAWRLVNNPATAKDYEDTIAVTSAGPRWSGKVNLLYRRLGQPMWRKKPTIYFVCSMADLFHPTVRAAFIVNVYEAMAACPQHTFIVCTKRPGRIVPVLYGPEGHWYLGGGDSLPNVWHLVSVENRECADRRIPELLQLREMAQGWPVLGVSAEPLLEPIDLQSHLGTWTDGAPYIMRGHETVHLDAPTGGLPKYSHLYTAMAKTPDSFLVKRGLDWVICGAESGPGARPMDLDWARTLKNQCQAAGVPYFLKQAQINGKLVKMPELDGRQWAEMPGDEYDRTYTK